MDIQKIKNTASLNTNKKAYIYTLTSTLFIFLLIFIFYKINPFGEYTLYISSGVKLFLLLQAFGCNFILFIAFAMA